MYPLLNKHTQVQLAFLTMLIFLAGISTNLHALTNQIPEPFRGQDPNSTITINYDDYSTLLKMSVMDIGRSTREVIPEPVPETGTRIRARINTKTAMEGNRFLFEIYANENIKNILSDIRRSFERVPEEITMSSLTNNEQLAFWLNLYNITLLEQIVEIYPINNLRKSLYDDGILDRKILKVSGIKLSLNDIHKKIIIAKFSNMPTAMYGLFQGTIGGPNIRNSAFTGELVESQLRDNALDFINSNRGTYSDKSNHFRVSTFYEQNSQLFPNFNHDLRVHLTKFLDSDYYHHLENADEIDTDIRDLNISDLKGGQQKPNATFASNSAAILGAVNGSANWQKIMSWYVQDNNARINLDYTKTTIQLLNKLREKYNSNRAKIIISEGDSENSGDL